MSDASEVLSAIYESLSMVEEGQKLVRELFEWQVSPLPPFKAPLCPKPAWLVNLPYM